MGRRPLALQVTASSRAIAEHRIPASCSGLWTVEPGDIIKLSNVQGDQFEYVVDRVEKVEELGQPLAQRLANASYMAPAQDALLTLITCWPDWAYTHRVIVVARLR